MGTGREDCGPSLTRLMQTQTSRLRRMRHGVCLCLCSAAVVFYTGPNAMSHCSRCVKGHLSGQMLYHCLHSNGFIGADHCDQLVR